MLTQFLKYFTLRTSALLSVRKNTYFTHGSRKKSMLTNMIIKQKDNFYLAVEDSENLTFYGMYVSSLICTVMKAHHRRNQRVAVPAINVNNNETKQLHLYI